MPITGSISGGDWVMVGGDMTTGQRYRFPNNAKVEFPLGVEFTEQSDPSAPAANRAALYSRDNGSGKTQIVARFPTGAVQVIATEP